MKRNRYTEEQIISILNEPETGVKVDELYRRHGMSSPTFYAWKAKFGGMEISEAKRLRALEDENRRLKQIVGDLSLDNHMLKSINEKKW